MEELQNRISKTSLHQFPGCRRSKNFQLSIKNGFFHTPAEREFNLSWEDDSTFA